MRHRQGCRLKAAFEALAARHLAIETAVKVDQRRLRGADVVVRVGRAGRRLGERPAEGFVEQPNLVVALDEAIAQLALLQFELGRQCGVLLLKLAQPANIRAVRGADHMGEHVHIAERFAHDGVGRRRVAEDGPIGARNIATPHRIVP